MQEVYDLNTVILPFIFHGKSKEENVSLEIKNRSENSNRLLSVWKKKSFFAWKRGSGKEDQEKR